MAAPQPIAVWKDGALSDPAPTDAGLLSGLGIFDTVAVISGRPFALDRHLARLDEGAQRLGLPAPPRSTIAEAVAQVVRSARGHPYCRLRLTWTPGAVGDGELLVTLTPFTPGHAVSVHLSPFRRNENSAITGVKSTSYAENLVAIADARRHGADEPILANTRGELCEGATSNVFIEHSGELVTPALTSGCLPGVTRQLCLKWGREAGLNIRETNLPFSVMHTAAHAAVTSAIKGVVPVHKVAQRGMETGPLTRQLADIYFANRSRELAQATPRT